MRRGRKAVFVALGVALALAPGAVAAQEPDSSAGRAASPALRERTAAEDLELFSQVLNQIRVNYPDSVDVNRLFMAAIAGMVSAVDPHSFVIPADRLSPRKEKELRAGKLVEVPIEFRYIGGTPVVVGVAPGTRAARLDILPGDQLVAVNGANVSAESAAELELDLAGPDGSKVELTFERRRIDGSLARVTRSVRRERTKGTSAIATSFLISPHVGYVRVTTFMAEHIAHDLGHALDSLQGAGMTSLILDLRDNGGGSVKEAADVASMFLPRGAIVYTSEGRKRELDDTVRVKRAFWKSARRYPIVLLVNAGTASASELVAGALQDHDRALVVGRPTFGKSLEMMTLPLSDGSLLVLTVAKLRTPCGRIIQREYRNIRVADYYRLAREQRERAGRPTCHSDHGRVLYGGGGIFPDVLLPERRASPLWLARAEEENLLLRWVGGYVSAHEAELTDPVALVPEGLPADALEGFRQFAAKEGVVIPPGADVDQRLTHTLLREIASARWGETGYARVSAMLDPEVAAAAGDIPQAAALLEGGPGPG